MKWRTRHPRLYECFRNNVVDFLFQQFVTGMSAKGFISNEPQKPKKTEIIIPMKNKNKNGPLLKRMPLPAELTQEILEDDRKQREIDMALNFGGGKPVEEEVGVEPENTEDAARQALVRDAKRFKEEDGGSEDESTNSNLIIHSKKVCEQAVLDDSDFFFWGRLADVVGETS